MLKSWAGRFAVSLVLLFASVYFLWAFLTELLAMVASIIVTGLWYAGSWAAINLLVLVIAYGVLSAWKDRRRILAGIGRVTAFFLEESQANELPHKNHDPRALRSRNDGPRRFASAHSHRYGDKAIAAEHGQYR